MISVAERMNRQPALLAYYGFGFKSRTEASGFLSTRVRNSPVSMIVKACY